MDFVESMHAAQPWPAPGTAVVELMTPMVLIDEKRVASNIARVQDYMDSIGRAFRPHIKTHKLPEIAVAQVAAGACGINCQKLTEAEVFAAAGFGEILITYNMLGAARLARLQALNERVPALSVTADNEVVVDGLAARFATGKPLTVLVECDTSAGRCGVQTPEAAAALAARIDAAPGLRFGGLMTYPATGAAAKVEAFIVAALSLLGAAGIACPVISVGGTPDLFQSHLIPSATEHRAGTYVYNDRSTIRSGHSAPEQCAMHILATVVSRPTEDRAVLDTGSKSLTSDLLGFPDFGLIEEYPGARIVSLSEEHGTVDLSGVAGRRPEVGELVRVLPNHTCVVSNMFDKMVFHDNGVVTRVLPVAARGMVW